MIKRFNFRSDWLQFLVFTLACVGWGFSAIQIYYKDQAAVVTREAVLEQKLDDNEKRLRRVEDKVDIILDRLSNLQSTR